MGNKSSLNIRNRVVTEFEYIQTLSPSKLAVYLRTILAHNQGCPPVPLIQVFSMCRDNSSCDDCWWTWLCSQHVIERQPKAAKKAAEKAPKAAKKAAEKAAPKAAKKAVEEAPKAAKKAVEEAPKAAEKAVEEAAPKKKASVKKAPAKKKAAKK